MSSEIVEFYKGSTVLLTGGTGFLGRVFVEKLLRSCPDLKRLYLIVRPKKGKDVQVRFQDIFEGCIFDQLRLIDPDFTQKVTLIAGDCSESNLGLNEDDRSKLIEEVDCIIHSAATVRFDEKLKIAININVRATRDLIEIAKKMTKLRAMVHISTAFSHCTRSKIDEIIYDVPISGKNLIRLSEILDDDQLEEITPTIMGKNPNSYILTKAAAEQIIKIEGKDLPIAVVRPSIVIGSVREPLAGWIENIFGASGIMIGAGIGLIHSFNFGPQIAAEMVPVDYSVNCALAAAWNVSAKKKMNNGDISVYNFVSAPEARIVYDKFIGSMWQLLYDMPTLFMIWYPVYEIRQYKYHHRLAVILMQTIPAYIIDFVLVCLGKKAILVKTTQKIDKLCTLVAHFALNEWVYNNENVQNLWKKMNVKDKAVFEFSMANFDWDDYMSKYAKGLRVYMLKDPMETIPQGKVLYFKLKIAHYTLVTILALMILLILKLILNLLF